MTFKLEHDPVRRGYAARVVRNIQSNRDFQAPQRRFIASELGKCKRQMWYRQDGWIPVPRSARLDDFGNDGDAHHNLVRDFLRESGVEVQGVTEFNEETMILDGFVNHKELRIPLHARLDGAIRIGRTFHVLEIKSLNSRKFLPYQNLWEKTLDIDALYDYMLETNPEFLYQIHAGMYLAKRKHGYVLLKDRNNCAIGLHSNRDPAQIIGGVPVPFDAGVWQTACNRMATVHKHILDGTPPRPEFLQSSKECGQCPYFHVCHGATKRKAAGMTPAAFHPVHGVVLNVRDYGHSDGTNAEGTD